MKLSAFLLLLVIAFSSCSEDDISGTQKKCKEILENLPTTQHKTLGMSAHSAESSGVNFYYRDNKIVLATVATYDESNRSNTQYFFDDNDLICVVQDDYVYNRPTYMTEERALKDGDSVWYDDSKTKMTTTRYYFYDGRMVKWINKDNKVIPETNKKYDFQAAILLRDAEKIKKMAGVTSE